MALAGTDRGALADSTSATTYAVAPNGTIAAGRMAVLFMAYDNSGTNGADPYSSIADSVGNTWSVGNQQLNDPGAANAGLVLRAWYSKLTTQLTTSDLVTVTFGTATAAKAATIIEVATDATNGSVSFVGAGEAAGNSGAAGATPPTVARSIATGRICIGATGGETTNAVTPDSDTTNGSWSTHQTNSAGAVMRISTQQKVVNATGTQTYNTALGNSVDWCALILEFREDVTSPAECATVTGAAGSPTASLTPNAGNCAVAGVANSAAASLAPNAGNAAVAGAASNPSTAIAPNAGNAAVTGVANSATASLAPNAGAASVTGSTGDPSVSLAPNAGAAAIAGAAHDPTAALGVQAGAATAVAAALAATVALAVSAGNPSATAAAYNAIVSLLVNAGVATVAGAAYDAVAILPEVPDPYPYHFTAREPGPLVAAEAVHFVAREPAALRATETEPFMAKERR